MFALPPLLPLAPLLPLLDPLDAPLLDPLLPPSPPPLELLPLEPLLLPELLDEPPHAAGPRAKRTDEERARKVRAVRMVASSGPLPLTRASLPPAPAHEISQFPARLCP